jgi:hypothetical protein
MPDAFGYDSSVGFGEESTWGTTVARTKFMEFITESMKGAVELQVAPSVRSLSERRLQDFLISATGAIEMEGIFEGLEKLWKHLFGAVATTNPGTNTYNHQFTLTNALPPGLSVEVYKGDDANLEAAGADTAHLYGGCKIASVTIAFKPNDPLRLTWNITAQKETLVAKTTVTFPDLSGALLIKGHHVLCERADVAYTIDEAELTIDNGLNLTKRVLGSQYIAQPVRNVRRKISGKIIADWSDKTRYNDLLTSAGAAAGTLFKLELLATGATIPGSSPTAAYKFNLTLPNCKLEGETPTVQNAGILKQPLPFRALGLGTGTSDACYLDIQNALTAV